METGRVRGTQGIYAPSEGKRLDIPSLECPGGGYPGTRKRERRICPVKSTLVEEFSPVS